MFDGCVADISRLLRGAGVQTRVFHESQQRACSTTSQASNADDASSMEQPVARTRALGSSILPTDALAVQDLLPTSSIPSAGALSSPTLAVKHKQPQQQQRPQATTTSTSLPKNVNSASVSTDVTDLKSVRSLSNKHRAFLLKAGFTTTQEVLYTPLKTLSDRLRLSEHECRELIQAIVTERKKRWITDGRSKSVAEQLRQLTKSVPRAAASSTVQEPPSLLFGDDGWLDLLGGGLIPGTLTEVAGEASSGKTAFSLQLSLRVQLAFAQGGLAGSCAYLSSEGNFPSTRLRDMAFKLSDGTAESIKTFMDNVHLIHCPEVDELLHVVRYSLPAMVEQSHSNTTLNAQSKSRPVKLVIVDSIAAPFRGSEGGGGKGAITEEDINKSANTNLAARNAALHEIAFRLRKLARKYSLVVLLVNQVSDVFHKDNDRFSGSQAHPSSQHQANAGSVTHENGGVPLEYRNYKHASKFFTGEEANQRNNGSGSKIAVFGLNWSNCIDCRIMLSRTGRRRNKESGLETLPHYMLDENGLEMEDPLFALETEEIRRATLIFSPVVDKGYVEYALRQEGLITISGYHPTPRGVIQSKRRGRKGINGKAGNLNKNADQSSEEDSDEEEAALWADMPLDDATLSQL